MLEQNEVKAVEQVIAQETPRSNMAVTYVVAAVIGIGAMKTSWSVANAIGVLWLTAWLFVFLMCGLRWRHHPEVAAGQLLGDTALTGLRDTLSADARDLLLAIAGGEPLRIGHLTDLLARSRLAREQARNEADAAVTLARQREMLGIESHEVQ